jgi:feruloyl esterase
MRLVKPVLAAALPVLCLGSETVALAQPGAYAPPPAATNKACADVAALSLPQTRITRAEAVKVDGVYDVPGTDNGYGGVGPAKVRRSFCRVSGVVAPAINFDVWMPQAGWNGRFQGFGLGAFLGKLPYKAMAESLDKGYAVGGTDTGHASESDDGTWAMKDGKANAQLVADWTGRGIHEMTVKSKAVVQAFYGQAPHHSYFHGCSSGGFQALTEVQKYPADYDGVLAGAPANYITHLQAAQLSFGLATAVDPATNLGAPIDKFPALYSAVIGACDSIDGVKDGLIENPAVCTFNPATIACKGADGPTCLTAPQVKAVQRLYGDVKGRSGAKIFPGFSKGSENNWKLMAGGYLGTTGQVAFAQSFYRYFVFLDPTWNYKTMDLDRDVATADRNAGKLNSNDPNLRPFRDRGGKLIQYHGWADWGITPYSSIDYFNSVVKEVGGASTPAARQSVQEFYRLFMMPGMSHCRGGVGPDVFDGLSSLVAWVEQGQAPVRMTAAKLEGGKPVRTRPICSYPEQARYKGRGSTDEAENFECVRPA